MDYLTGLHFSSRAHAQQLFISDFSFHPPTPPPKIQAFIYFLQTAGPERVSDGMKATKRPATPAHDHVLILIAYVERNTHGVEEATRPFWASLVVRVITQDQQRPCSDVMSTNT